MEAAVLQHHLQHDAGAAPGQFAPVQPGRIDTGKVTAGNAVDEVLHVQAFAGPLPVHAGDQDVVTTAEVARDAFGVTAFGGEIQFASQRHGELLHDLGRTIAAQVRQPRLDNLGQAGQQPQIGLDHIADAGPPDFQHHLTAIV